MACSRHQVARTPDAVAVVYEGEQVSYAELNRRANRVAHRLRTLGVKADDRVAICAERSVEMVVGLLGILKSGGAYVPLDPSYPAERLRYMVEDSAPLALLTQSALVESVCEWLPAPVLPVLALDGVDSFIDEPTHDPDASGLRPRTWPT
ncbi:AMP-binding protein [Pseudoxanthomonas mexicana]